MGIGLIELTKEHAPHELAWAGNFYVTRDIIDRKIYTKITAFERRMFRMIIIVHVDNPVA